MDAVLPGFLRGLCSEQLQFYTDTMCLNDTLKRCPMCAGKCVCGWFFGGGAVFLSPARPQSPQSVSSCVGRGKYKGGKGRKI